MAAIMNGMTRTDANLRLAGLFRDAQGSAMVETTLSILLVMSMVFWGFELCLLCYTEAVLENALRMGVRYAIVHGADSTSCSGPSSGCGDPSGADVIAVVQKYAANSVNNVSGMTVTVNYPDGSSAALSRVIVSFKYPYVPVLTLPGMSPTLQGVSEGRIVY
jgi:Flp pilus assembly protein TadG